MSRHINHGTHSWSNTQDIPQAERTVQSGGRVVIWPAHVKVQVIPGMERTAGLPGNVYVDPASVARVDVRDWGVL